MKLASWKVITNTFFVASILLGSAAQAETFRSFLLPSEFDSETGLLVDREDWNSPRVIAKNPEIIRRENDQGIEITFRKQGQDLIKISMPFSHQTDDEIVPDRIFYKGQTATVLTHLSLQMAPQSKKELCAYSKDLNKFQKLLKTSTNRISYTNNGGIGGNGVCWWYSRLERKATYLTYYSPHKRKPSRTEAIRLLAKIRTGEEIVEIPGFPNFHEFTEEFYKEVQSNLDGWQISDGVFGGAWINGLQGSSETSAQELKNIMDATYEQVVKKKSIAYQMLQMPGFTAHAWLVVGMKRIKDGYVLQTVDSNFNGQVHLVEYKYGMTQFSYSYQGTTTLHVPYLQKPYIRENERTISALQKACAN